MGVAPAFTVAGGCGAALKSSLSWLAMSWFLVLLPRGTRSQAGATKTPLIHDEGAAAEVWRAICQSLCEGGPHGSWACWITSLFLPTPVRTSFPSLSLAAEIFVTSTANCRGRASCAATWWRTTTCTTTMTDDRHDGDERIRAILVHQDLCRLSIRGNFALEDVCKAGNLFCRIRPLAAAGRKI